eukprot:Skav203628  [mRNA]  locus=scaffold935:935210:938716:- [translate_table: standard]
MVSNSQHRFPNPGRRVWVFVPGDYEPIKSTSKDLLHFVDWDGDGDVDILLGTYLQNSFHIQFRERISDQSFRVHDLVTIAGLHRSRPISKDWYFFHPDEIENSPSPEIPEAYGSNSSTVEGFQVADWDGDGGLDLLLCMQGPTATNITFLSRALLPVNSIENGSLILSTSSVRQDTLCDMQPVDFDEDGVVDLFLGGFTRYFRRESTDSDLIEQMNPLGIYNGSVLQVFDFDADGHLELLLDAFGPNDHMELVAFRWLRRALDGSFVESEENPFVDVQLENLGNSRERFKESHLGKGYPGYWIQERQEMYLADWNSDGLPDIVVLHFYESREEGESRSWVWHRPERYQQVRNRDMMHNSHLAVFDQVRVSNGDHISVLDWNQDGFDDHVDIHGHTQLYEISDAGAKPVLAKPTEATTKSPYHRHSFVDWDGDGDLDFLGQTRGSINVLYTEYNLEYWEQVNGQFRFVETLGIPRQPWPEHFHRNQFFPVDWDQDGDVDLVLVEEVAVPFQRLVQARYFERLPDGSLSEKQQHPFRNFTGIFLNNEGIGRDPILSLHFLDCDGDGDLDVLQVHIASDKSQVQACENDQDAGTVTCSNLFLCLRTNVSNFRYEWGHGDAFGIFGWLQSLDVVNVSEGLLQFAAIHWDKPHPVLWTAGFCVPSSPCHGKGFCNKGHQHCTCQKGHELEDCSQCERSFHGVFRDAWHVRECKSCPESDGHLCHGRGECFDDAQSSRDSTALLVAGNGSCRCHEAVKLKNHMLTSTALMRTAETLAQKGVVQLEVKKEMGDVILATEVRFLLQGGLVHRVALDHIHPQGAARAQHAKQEEWQSLQGLQRVMNVQQANSKGI